MNAPTSRRLKGAAVIEFAIVAMVFFMVLIGIMEMGRILFYWNTATEMTRLGARVAVVCNMNSAAISDKMQALYPQLFVQGNATVAVAYFPANCAVDTCTEATVSFQTSAPIITNIPLVPLNLSLPAFSTTLPRESLASTVSGGANPVCQ